jgi:phage head maturation protease
MEVLQRSMFIGEIRAVLSEDAEKGVMEHPVSSLAVDAYSSIVWFSETEWHDEIYKYSLHAGRSIPILYEHGGGGLFTPIDRDPLGINLKLWIEGDGVSAETKLLARSEFDLEDGRAKERFRKHKKGYVKGWSIGFRPKRILKEDEADDFLKAQGRDERGITVYLAPELFEYSSVLWPANTDAYDKSKQVELVKRALESLGYGSDDQVIRRIEELSQRLTQCEGKLGLSSDNPRQESSVGDVFQFLK